MSIKPFSLSVIIISLFLASCSDSIEKIIDDLLPLPEQEVIINTNDDEKESELVIPQDKGAFTLVAEKETAARTIMPGALDWNNFKSYSLIFTNTGTGAQETVFRTNADLSHPVFLDAGTYNLVLTAYIDNDKPVARGQLFGININIGISVAHIVTINPIVSHETGENREGTFNWSIAIPAGLTSANMMITPINSATGTPEQTVTFTNGITNTDSLSLRVGYYRLTFTLRKDRAWDVIRNEILHVYQNMESNFSFAFTDNDFNKNYNNVTFHFNNGENPGTGIRDVNHNTAVSPITPEPARTGYVFNGWYLDDTPAHPFTSAFTNTAYNFNTSVMRDTNLYALWLGDIRTANITVTPGSDNYDGNFKTPAVTVIHDGNTLTAGTHYIVEYTNNRNAGTASAVITGVESYGYGFSQTVNFVINPKVITITGVTAAAREYDNTTTVALAGGTLQGVETGDDVTFTLGTGTIPDVNVGTAKAVTTAISLGGASAGNYTLTQPTVTVNITQRQLTLTVTGSDNIAGLTGTTLSPVDATVTLTVTPGNLLTRGYGNSEL